MNVRSFPYKWQHTSRIVLNFQMKSLYFYFLYLSFFWLNLKQTFSRNVYFMFANLTYLLLYLWFQCIYIALLPPFYWLLAVRKSAVFQTKGNIKNLGTYIFLVDRLMRNPVNEICVSYWHPSMLIKSFFESMINFELFLRPNICKNIFHVKLTVVCIHI